MGIFLLVIFLVIVAIAIFVGIGVFQYQRDQIHYLRKIEENTRPQSSSA